MPWNEETGAFDLLYNFRDDVVAGGDLSYIQSDRIMLQLEDLASALDSLLVSTGRKAVGGNLDFSGHKVVDVGDAVEGSSYVAAKQAAGAVISIGTFGGSANALSGSQLFTPNPIPVGYEISGVAQLSNTGAMTYSHNSSAPAALNDRYGVPLPAGSVLAGDIIRLIRHEDVVGEATVVSWRLQTSSRHEYDGYLAARSSNPSTLPRTNADGAIEYKQPPAVRASLGLHQVATSASYLHLTGGIPDLISDRLIHGTARAGNPLSVDLNDMTVGEVAHIDGALPLASEVVRGKLSASDILVLGLIEPVLFDLGTAMAIDPAVVPDITGGTEFSYVPTPSGGYGAYEFYISAGSLPAGLVFDNVTGEISGIAHAPSGAVVVTVLMRDDSGAAKEFALTITVVDPAIAFDNAVATDATAYRPYSFDASASGPSAPYVYTVHAGSLPAGLTLNAVTGEISGSPGASGTGTTFTIRATDRGGYFEDIEYTIGVISPTLVLNPTSITSRVRTIATSIALSVAGNGTEPYAYERTAGTIPPGLALDAATGVLSGTPTTNGTYNFTIRATDAHGFTATRAYSVLVYTPSITLQPGTIAPMARNVAMSLPFSVVGNGTEPYTYSVQSGAIPVGVSLNETTGVLSGTPTINGVYDFTIRGTDANGFFAQRSYSVLVAPGSVVISPATIDAPVGSAPYSVFFSADGGTAPYTYAISSGFIPTGLTFNTASGAMSGTVTGAGTFNFTVRAVDANGFVAERAYTTTVVSPSIVISPTSIAVMYNDTSYTHYITATGGATPHTFSVSGGALPTGMTLASNGTLAGTPANGSYTFTIKAADQNGFYAERTYTVSVVSGPAVGTVRSFTCNVRSNGGEGNGWVRTVSSGGYFSLNGTGSLGSAFFGTQYAGQTWRLNENLFDTDGATVQFSRQFVRIS